MPAVPAFILRRLYVKGSLENVEGGWQFTLKNSLGSGYAKEMLPVTVDGNDVPLPNTTFRLDGTEMSFDRVNDQNTFGLPMNRSIVISAAGDRLTPGPHKIGMHFVVPGFGEIGFDFTDEVAD
ncbi:MAG: hypothetical protein WD208_04120 [Dehalococcoidia bacterium]